MGGGRRPDALGSVDEHPFRPGSELEAAPFRESSYGLLMEALEARDNVAEALRVYDALRVLLREELGVAPGRAPQEVHEHLLRQVDVVRRSG